MNVVQAPTEAISELARKCVFWGKFDQVSGRALPLVAHCLDVAMVFRHVANLPRIRQALDNSMSMSDKITGHDLDRLAVLAMLHDVGKANLGFQLKVFSARAPRGGHIRELAPMLDFEACEIELHQSFIHALPPELPAWFGDEQSAYSYLLAIFSHHGRPLMFKGEKSGTYMLARNKWWRSSGQWDPMKAISEISQYAREAFPSAFETVARPLPRDPAFHHRFAGLLMLSDWLGSDPNWFPILDVTFPERLEANRIAIPKQLTSIGLDIRNLRPILQTRGRTFQERFGREPYPLQAAIDDLDPTDSETRLVIAESETGSGKTEAALNWFGKLFSAGLVDGLYFALPTRVAARELYARIHKVICRWFPDPSARPVTVLAVPGYAQVDGTIKDRSLPDSQSANLWQDDADLQRRERTWAAEHPKRFLAAPIAVGTIDQALLSIIQTPHAHLRSVCLDRHLLVVDEVHASDSYMSKLLQTLLCHHVKIGGRAMLLSATLGARARAEYIGAVGTEGTLPKLAEAVATPYPSLTLADGISRPTLTTTGSSKEVLVETVPLALRPEAIVPRLISALSVGARILVVLNTVRRANALLRTLEEHPDMDPAWLFTCRGIVCPHHGRFAPEDRLVLDARVTGRMGREGALQPVALIGTQTLEQSLDIDADLIVSDLAPADVLLQRIGRLHRHKRSPDKPRPPGFEAPRMLLLLPEGDLEPSLDARGEVASDYRSIGYGSVYADLRTLELTRRAFLKQPEITIPRDNRQLVEAITHPECLAELSQDRWQRHGQLVEGKDMAQELAAGMGVSTFDRYFGDFEFNEIGGKVATRLGADSLRLPLAPTIYSPFGQKLRYIVIPGHMAPDHPDDEVSVETNLDGVIHLRCADRRYKYSRFGLEDDI